MTTTARRRIHHPIQKDYATFLRTSEETGGEYTLIEVEVAPGGGNALHLHRSYDERFEVVRGALTVEVDGVTRTLRAGQSTLAPMNSLHRFMNATAETTVFLVELRPGSPGFEKALTIAYGLAADGLANAQGTPRSLYQTALLLEWSDIRMPGLFSLAEPLIRLLAQRARSKGIDRMLEERYCR